LYSTDFNNSGKPVLGVFFVVPLHQLLVAVVEQPTINRWRSLEKQGKALVLRAKIILTTAENPD
jgi:hypothetical protein